MGTRGVSSLSANSGTDDHGVLEQSRRRETFSHLDVRRRILRQGEVLCSRPFDPLNSLSPFQLSIGATGRGFVVPPASGAAKSGGLRRSILWQACSASGWSVDWTWVARCPPVSKGMGYRKPCAFERSRAGSEGKRGGRRGSKRACRSRRRRGSDARGVCPCVVIVSLQKSSGSARPREACAPHFTRFGWRTGTGV